MKMSKMSRRGLIKCPHKHTRLQHANSYVRNITGGGKHDINYKRLVHGYQNHDNASNYDASNTNIFFNLTKIMR